jgi:phage gpG-like protein
MESAVSGVGMTWGFDDALIRGHLGRLYLVARGHFDSARREIGEYMVGEVQDNLDGQKLADGSAMPPSAAAQGRTTHYKRDNKKKGYVKGSVRAAGKTLIDTHQLYDSYVWQAKGLGVEVGSNREYAAIQHFGGDTGRGGKTHIDARPVLGVKPADEARIGDFLVKQILAAQA